MKKNKGFTLIELLTVIAILAIILLIAAPTILGVLDKARKNTFKNQVLLYVEALKTEVALSATGNSDMNLTLPNVGETKEIDISTIPMDTNPGYTGSIIIKNDGNNKYTYTLSEIASKEYKITEDIEATKLEVSKITKADEKVEDKEETNEPEEPATTTVYYAFGEPTTSSATDYTTLTYPTAGTQAKVFVSLEGNQKSVCIVINDKPECFKNNSVTEEREHLMLVYDSMCTSTDSNLLCYDDLSGCDANSDGAVSCQDDYSYCEISSDGNVDCYEW